MLVVMLVAAINYQNNMAYGLTFLLGCVFVIAVHHTFANLHRLTVKGVGVERVFAGQQAAFTVRLEAPPQRQFQALRIGWTVPDQLLDVPRGGTQTVVLYHAVAERGWYRPGRFLLETRFPVGLLRCWTWLDLDMRALVYPKPIDPPMKPLAPGDSTDGLLPLVGSGDDLADFRDYRPGDSLRAVNWRAWAKGLPLTTKVYGEPFGDAIWLDFSAFTAGDTEQRLSWLCALVLLASSAGDVYGLRLPNLELAPSSGESHRDMALRALALYGSGGEA